MYPYFKLNYHKAENVQKQAGSEYCKWKTYILLEPSLMLTIPLHPKMILTTKIVRPQTLLTHNKDIQDCGTKKNNVNVYNIANDFSNNPIFDYYILRKTKQYCLGHNEHIQNFIWISYSITISKFMLVSLLTNSQC